MSYDDGQKMYFIHFFFWTEKSVGEENNQKSKGIDAT